MGEVDCVFGVEKACVCWIGLMRMSRLTEDEAQTERHREAKRERGNSETDA
jgi:hypothetical protein